MSNKLTYNSTLDEVGWSLRETLELIKKVGETKELKYEMLLKYGRFKLLEGDLDKAYETLQHCSIHGLDHQIGGVNELYYWSARCIEEQGDKERALNSYLVLLDIVQSKDGTEELVNAILDRLILFGDVATLVEEFRIKRQKEIDHPADILGKIRKVLRDMQ